MIINAKAMIFISTTTIKADKKTQKILENLFLKSQKSNFLSKKQHS